MYKEMTPLSMEKPENNLIIKKKGMLIALEGLDGAGKTTLSSLCVEELIKMGYNAEKFRNSSGYTAYWQSVMEAKRYMSQLHQPIPGEIDQSLHAFEFLTYVRCTLPILLEENDYVFCDRYVLGKMVLADMDTRKVNSWTKEMLKEMFKNGTVPKPDLNIYLHLSPEKARERILKRGESLELKEEMYMLKEAYSIFNKYQKEYQMTMIDCNKDKETIVNAIIDTTLSIEKDNIEYSIL